MRRSLLVAFGLGSLALAACGGSGARPDTHAQTLTGQGIAGGRFMPYPGASSPGVVSAGAVQSKAAPQDYWTQERMAKAQPVSLIGKHGAPKEARRIPAPEGKSTSVSPTEPRGGAPSHALPGKRLQAPRPHGYPFPYSRYRWGGPTTDLPARTWGKVFFSAPDGDYVCSGTAVTSNNKSVVWTAGHCAADGGSKLFYNHNWIFVPGYDNGKAPFGKFVGKRFFTNQAWFKHGDSAFDEAAVVVAPAKGKTLVDAVGGQGIAFNQPRTQDYVSGGYPADYPFDGKTLYVCTAPLGNSDRETRPPTIAIGCDMTGGSSGGGWLVNVQNGLGTLVSVNSYGYFDQPDAMYGPYQGNAAHRLYDQASSYR